MDYIYVVLYVLFAVCGSSLLKYGSEETVKTLFVVPFVNMNVSLISLIGFISYGISFLLYTVLLSKFELSFISPLTVGIVYVLLMLTAFIFFKEPITMYKIIGSSLILLGILFMLIKK